MAAASVRNKFFKLGERYLEERWGITGVKVYELEEVVEYVPEIEDDGIVTAIRYRNPDGTTGVVAWEHGSAFEFAMGMEAGRV